MNCQLSHLLLAFRPDELAAEDQVALDAHLVTCTACAARAKSSAAVDSAFRRAMLAVPVPSGLQAKLHASVTATHRIALRRRLAVWGSGILAASVFLTLTTAIALHFLRPVMSSEIASHTLEDERLMKEQRVKEWLDSEGVPNELPAAFDFRFHSAHGTGPLGPLRVPFVLFQNDRGQCRVYVLRKDSVNTPTGGWSDVFGSEFNIKAVEQGEVVYLIAVSTSTTLDDFLKTPPPLA